MIMASQEKRNHHDLKETGNYYVTKTYLKRLARKSSSLYNVARGVWLKACGRCGRNLDELNEYLWASGSWIQEK